MVAFCSTQSPDTYFCWDEVSSEFYIMWLITLGAFIVYTGLFRDFAIYMRDIIKLEFRDLSLMGLI